MFWIVPAAFWKEGSPPPPVPIVPPLPTEPPLALVVPPTPVVPALPGPPASPAAEPPIPPEPSESLPAAPGAVAGAPLALLIVTSPAEPKPVPPELAVLPPAPDGGLPAEPSPLRGALAQAQNTIANELASRHPPNKGGREAFRLSMGRPRDWGAVGERACLGDRPRRTQCSRVAETGSRPWTNSHPCLSRLGSAALELETIPGPEPIFGLADTER